MGINWRYAVAVLQVLHYLPESMQEKVAYLRDIGMGQEQVTQTILRLPQLLSLDVHRNLQPKYSYLKHQLGGTVKTLCKYPAYFSLSLPGRYGFLHLTLLFTNTMQCRHLTIAQYMQTLAASELLCPSDVSNLSVCRLHVSPTDRQHACQLMQHKIGRCTYHVLRFNMALWSAGSSPGTGTCRWSGRGQ